MIVKVLDGDGKLLWIRTSEPPSGLTNKAYLTDGTQHEIIESLENALAQAKAEAGIFTLSVEPKLQVTAIMVMTEEDAERLAKKIPGSVIAQKLVSHLKEGDDGSHVRDLARQG